MLVFLSGYFGWRFEKARNGEAADSTSSWPELSLRVLGCNTLNRLKGAATSYARFHHGLQVVYRDYFSSWKKSPWSWSKKIRTMPYPETKTTQLRRANETTKKASESCKQLLQHFETRNIEERAKWCWTHYVGFKAENSGCQIGEDFENIKRVY